MYQARTVSLSLHEDRTALEQDSASSFVFALSLNTRAFARLDLRNACARPMAFKIKTSAPRKYLVRPNKGTVPPHGHTRVTLIAHPQS